MKMNERKENMENGEKKEKEENVSSASMKTENRKGKEAHRKKDKGMTAIGRLAARTAFIFFMTLSALQGIVFAGMLYSGVYEGLSKGRLEEQYIKRITRCYAEIVLREYATNNWENAHANVKEECSEINVNFTVYQDGTTLDNIRNVAGTEFYEYRYYMKDFDIYQGIADDSTDKGIYYVVCTVPSVTYYTDSITRSQMAVDDMIRIRYMILFTLPATLLVSILLLVLLVKNAGWVKGENELHTGFMERTALDLDFLTGFLLCGFTLAFLDALKDDTSFLYLFEMDSIMLGLLIICISSVVLSWTLLMLAETCGVRSKQGKWWENTVCYSAFSLLRRWNQKYFRKMLKTGIRWIDRNTPFLLKAVIVIGGIVFIEYWSVRLSGASYEGIIFWIMTKIILVIPLAYILSSMNKLQEGAKRLANGKLDEKIDTKSLLTDFKMHAEYLNNISLGMQRAVEERLKSERFKTELITNVSHDIKTPLTSIINYVDLLEKEPLDNETAKGYVEVLHRQSARLKKLIEDLIEASKASAGTVEIALADCEAGVLLEQAAGEYEEKLEKSGLELRIQKPEERLRIRADGRHLWRVFDNLLNNIYKYAQPGTRVYLSLEKRGQPHQNAGNNLQAGAAEVAEAAEIIFRNTSKYELNMGEEELQERFVRGDSSRSTEGSGLGISIAKSLTELMGGTFALTIDGDLFKVVLTFPLAAVPFME